MLDFQSYPWSSFQVLQSSAPTDLQRDEVLGWFGGKKGFLDYHNLERDLSLGDDISQAILSSTFHISPFKSNKYRNFLILGALLIFLQ